MSAIAAFKVHNVTVFYDNELTLKSCGHLLQKAFNLFNTMISSTSHCIVLFLTLQKPFLHTARHLELTSESHPCLSHLGKRHQGKGSVRFRGTSFLSSFGL